MSSTPQEMKVVLDSSLLRGYSDRLVSAVQLAVNNLQPPRGMSPNRREYWKAGAVAAVQAINAAIQSVPADEPNEPTLMAQNIAMRAAMQKFVDRVDAGEVRSRRTYAEFKAILEQQA